MNHHLKAAELPVSARERVTRNKSVCECLGSHEGSQSVALLDRVSGKYFEVGLPIIHSLSDMNPYDH